MEYLKASIKRKNDIINVINSESDASNEIYLIKKVVAIFGVVGACRFDELYNLETQDLDYKNNISGSDLFDKKQCKYEENS
jgi:hypothetical protein